MPVRVPLGMYGHAGGKSLLLLMYNFINKYKYAQYTRAWRLSKLRLRQGPLGYRLAAPADDNFMASHYFAPG